MFVINNLDNLIIETNNKHALLKILNKIFNSDSIIIKDKKRRYYINNVNHKTIKVLEKILDIRFNFENDIDILEITDNLTLLKINPICNFIIDNYFINNFDKISNEDITNCLNNIVNSQYVTPTIYIKDIVKYTRIENKLIGKKDYSKDLYVIYTTNDPDILTFIIKCITKHHLNIEEFIFDHYVYANKIIFTKSIFEYYIKRDKNNMLRLLKYPNIIKRYNNQKFVIKMRDIFPVMLFNTIMPPQYCIGIIDSKEKYTEIINYLNISRL